MSAKKVYQLDYFGFVYIWRDALKNKYYIGSHLGSTDDRYISSNKWMSAAYKKRPETFRRRILTYLTSSRSNNKESLKLLHAIEQQWLDLIPDAELSISANVILGRDRYYNMKKVAAGGNGSANKGKKKSGSWIKGLTAQTDNRIKDYGLKISAKLKGRPKSEAHKEALKGPRPSSRGPKGPNKRSKDRIWILISPGGEETVVKDIRQYAADNDISMSSIHRISRLGTTFRCKGLIGFRIRRA